MISFFRRFRRELPFSEVSNVSCGHLTRRNQGSFSRKRAPWERGRSSIAILLIFLFGQNMLHAVCTVGQKILKSNVIFKPAQK